ncbi:hypothetical protein AGABI2DRAFT_190476 [Agaricus bisporus var. bisporus H97]|uniref:hypothetical protein n=1 Tax=Agaricus bisporus var. bisporus (strain H97 / ATCC MYA-4626 / FGSC 10389) TaxID=936046 RepID=UPI00029F796C|nr:hypothetical protein AGABI2DRAFT_190476 [Agaricus bisporus var. bisporus H97]EKV50069.1 hypothetical protein AGABI2DRAFT_190476 [Agaricus bisporus var. bisporus H97]
MLLRALVLPFLALAALAADPVEQLSQLASRGNGNIKLDTRGFDLITSPKRTWSVTIQLTALSQRHKCTMCKEFLPAWNAVVRAWTSVPQPERDNHFFATLDFDDAPGVFQKLGLVAAPVVFTWAPAEGDRKSANTLPDKYDFNEGFGAGPFADSVSRHTPVKIPYREPIDWTRLILTCIFGLSLLLALRFASPLFQNMPYVGANGWIASGFQSQYGQEVHVVAFIYGLLSFSFLMLIFVVPNQKSPARQRAQVYLWSAVIVIIYSVLISLFRLKNRGYPFKLFI